jgi:hypothetical protein
MNKKKAKSRLKDSFKGNKALIGVGETEEGLQVYWNRDFMAPMYLNTEWEGYPIQWNFIEQPEAF